MSILIPGAILTLIVVGGVVADRWAVAHRARIEREARAARLNGGPRGGRR